MSDPVNEFTAIPSAVLHSVANPAEVFYSHNSVTPKMGQIRDFLCGKDSELTFLRDAASRWSCASSSAAILA